MIKSKVILTSANSKLINNVLFNQGLFFDDTLVTAKIENKGYTIISKDGWRKNY